MRINEAINDDSLSDSADFSRLNSLYNIIMNFFSIILIINIFQEMILKIAAALHYFKKVSWHYYICFHSIKL